ncbi:MAG: hypothetical protein WEG56_02010 [Chloroflexota bacterium]
MTADRVQALEALLVQAEAAHSVFEREELDGVYDEAWPRWYAAYAIDHGIGDLMTRSVSVDELARFFVSAWDEAQRLDLRPSEPWPTWMARRLAVEP